MYLLFAIAAMASVACEHTEELAPEAPATGLVQRDFTALVTKTALSGSSVVWQEGDKISVFAATGSAVSDGGAEYGLKNYDAENPSYKATFTGSIAAADSYFAVYPYSTSNAFDGDSVLTAYVPAQQVITSGSFAPGAAVVVGKSTAEYEFPFQNAVALLKVTLADSMSGATKIEISGNNGEIIAGAFTATYGESGFTFADAASGTSTTASLVYEGGNFVGGQSYYIAIRPCTFSKGLTAKAYFGEGNSNIAVKTSSVEVTINAGQILPLGTFNASNWAPTLELGDFETLTLESGTYLTFDYGQSETFPVNLALGVNTTALQDDGWTVSYSDGSVTITAPANNGSHAPQPGALVLTSTKNSSVTTSYGLRLRGIGSVEELEAFAAAQAPASGGTIAGKTIGHADTEACVPFLVNDEALFAADLSIAAANFDNHDHAYALHHNEFPINGNGRTVNLGTYTGSAWPLAFIQDLYYDVHDLTLTGNLSNSANNAIMGSLATRINSEVTVSNVSSSVNITYTGSTSANAFIGGIVGNVISSNKNATFDNCSYSGTISCSREVMAIGGIVARGEATGTTDNIWTTIQNSSFSGSIVYTPNTVNTKNTGIGGLIGISARRMKLIKCTTSGSVEANMNNKLLTTKSETVWGTTSKNVRAIGGVFGVTYGTNVSSPYAGYYLDDVVSSTTVTVNGANASQNNGAFQIRGYNQATIAFPAGGSKDSQGRTNILLNPDTMKVVYNYYTAPEISAAAAGTTSFSYGEDQDIPLKTGNLDGWTVAASAPAGWSVNTEHVTDDSPYITVTPPSQDDIKAGTAVGMGSITFTLTSDSYGSAPAEGDGVAVRLYGINSKDEFNAFKSVYHALNDTRVTAGLEDYMVDGKLSLNADLSFSTSDFYYVSNQPVYVIKWLYDELEGNYRTITFDNVTSAGTICGFFQGVKNNVSRLNFAGTITSTNGAAHVGTLASRGGYAKVGTTNGATILSYVNSSVHIIINPLSQNGSGAVGGLIGQTGYVDGGTQKLEHCNVSGTIENQTYTVKYMGGLIGATGSAVDPLTQLDDCTFSGTIIYRYVPNSTGSRNGGIFGCNDRQGILNNCTFSGVIRAYMNGNACSVSHCIGGAVGRTTASTTSSGKTFTMKCEINNFTYTGTITAYDATGTNFMGTCIGSDAGYAVTRVDGSTVTTSGGAYSFESTSVQTATSSGE